MQENTAYDQMTYANNVKGRVTSIIEIVGTTYRTHIRLCSLSSLLRKEPKPQSR